MTLGMFKPHRIVTLLALIGCASSNTFASQSHLSTVENSSYPTMAVPLQSTLNQEIEIAKLNTLLQQNNIAQETKAQAFYKRGRYYESVGLKDLARIDYGKSLQINPAQPMIYNHLGVYFTQVGEFDSAYEAFDSTIDLMPSNQDAIYNRAIALYYGGRYQLALDDIRLYSENNPKDPYSAIWYYIIESKIDKDKATQRLTRCHETSDPSWGWTMASVLLGELSEKQALELAINNTNSNVTMAQRLTEAYFYLGKMKRSQGKYAEALSMYKLAISFNVFDYGEHGYSFWNCKTFIMHSKRLK
ncbi:lipoprotein NlpI [Vibrio hannami]|nr:lipoprotein NlpI [Vibrio hannami]MDG3085721.1 lipoprotein NlpI [Vibrio hannami]